MHVLASGEVVYFISNICIILQPTANTQRHYKEHTQDVKCLAVHSNGILVASGQFASKLRPENVAHIRVWRSDLLQTTHVLGEGKFSKAVMCLAFMPNQDFLAAVDNSSDKHLTVWDLNKKDCAAENFFVTETVCDMDFNPKYPDLLVTCGKEHLQWWRFYPGDNSKLLLFTVADYETYLKAKYVVCAVHNDKGDLITGDSNGTVYIWADGSSKITNFVKHGHEGPVLSVLYHRGYLLSGGRDGHLSAWTWDKNMNKATSLQIPSSEGGIRQLLVKDGVLILCTTMNSVLSVTLGSNICPLDGVSLDPIPITQGHYDELRALTVISDSFLGANILTAGSDGVLCKFNSETHAPVWKLFVKGMQYMCVDCSSSGDFIVLGTRDGRVVGLQINKDNMQVMEVVNNKVATCSVLCIRLSQDQDWLAAGIEDGSIYIFRLTEQEDGDATWNVWGILKAHKGDVVCLDWTLQPQANGVGLLRSCSSCPQQKFWNVQTCLEVDGNELNTLSWATKTCSLDHLLIGVWNSKQAEMAEVKALDVNPSATLVAMGNSTGLLSLYRYPCTKDKVYSHTYQAHQTVQGVRFTPSGATIVTVGGHDSALLQWKLI